VKSRITEHFYQLFARLPADAQRETRAAYRLFLQNPRNPSLHFKRLSQPHPSVYSARVGAHYRALGTLEADTVTWLWIGTHDEYDKVI
jgi:mRNA-degrading endonuclease RelE of RelBE toxin-antitoxin system